MNSWREATKGGDGLVVCRKIEYIYTIWPDWGQCRSVWAETRSDWSKVGRTSNLHNLWRHLESYLITKHRQISNIYVFLWFPLFSQRSQRRCWQFPGSPVPASVSAADRLGAILWQKWRTLAKYFLMWRKSSHFATWKNTLARLRQVFKFSLKFCFGLKSDPRGSFGTIPSAIDVKNAKESKNMTQNPQKCLKQKIV